VALNLTKRQLICFSVAAAIGVPVYLCTRGVIGNTAAVLLMIGLMAPFFLLAMFERDGQPAERLLRNYLRAKWFFPSTRPYKTENLYRYLTKKEDVLLAEKRKTAGPAPAKHRPSGKGK
jgi:hypothetical protein